MNELKKANKSKIKCKELGKKLKQGRYKKKCPKFVINIHRDMKRYCIQSFQQMLTER